jgi:hypothetical protein
MGVSEAVEVGFEQERLSATIAAPREGDDRIMRPAVRA